MRTFLLTTLTLSLCYFCKSQDKLATHKNVVFMVNNKHKIISENKVSSNLAFTIYPNFATVNDLNKSTYTFNQVIDEPDSERIILSFKSLDENNRSCIFQKKCISDEDTVIAIIYQDRCFIYFKGDNINKQINKNAIAFYYKKYYFSNKESKKRKEKINPTPINVILNNSNLLFKDIITRSDDSKVKIWPNPTSVYLNISCGEFCPEKIEIWDNAGRVIFKSNFSNSINISQYRAGTYFISMISQKEVITKSFIKL